MSTDLHFINFSDPFGTCNIWQGSLEFSPVSGCDIRVLSEWNNPKMNVKEPLPVYALSELEITADVNKRFLLADMDRVNGGFQSDNRGLVLTELLNAKVMTILNDDALKSMEDKVSQFTMRSPIIFSFINHHAYETKIEMEKQFSVADRPFQNLRFENTIFSEIELCISKSMPDSSSGNVGKIEYSAYASFKPREEMKLWEVLRTSQLVEKVLFLLVGDHCGPLEIDIPADQKGAANRAEIKCSSKLYDQTDVVTGIWRCWTLDKVDLDFGKLIEHAFANFQKIEVPLELIIDANSQTRIENQFFKLVRAMEAIARDLMPPGSEKPPKELTQLQELVAKTGRPDVKKFLEQRVDPIFQKPNTLGYGIELALSTFPYPGLKSLNKQDVLKLRGIDAHARVHTFTSEQTQLMHNASMQLDFLCRACVLFALGMTRQEIELGIPYSRFTWVNEKSET